MGKFDDGGMEPVKCDRCGSTRLRVEHEEVLCNDCDHTVLVGVKPVEPDPWSMVKAEHVCPWCGVALGEGLELDSALEVHVGEDPCDAWLAEQV
jgi:DNA-directed RNA polymerase subunit RPC12/RpoP